MKEKDNREEKRRISTECHFYLGFSILSQEKKQRRVFFSKYKTALKMRLPVLFLEVQYGTEIHRETFIYYFFFLQNSIQIEFSVTFHVAEKQVG